VLKKQIRFWDSHSGADHRAEMEEEEMKFEAMEAVYEGPIL
jgi:hypothetical protein